VLVWADKRTRQWIVNAVVNRMNRGDLIDYRFNVRHMLDRNAIRRLYRS
jgi:hypothetical protein